MDLWRGSEPVDAVGLTTDEGIVIRFEPTTGEVVGLTILDWAARWQAQDVIEVVIPSVGASQSHNGGAPTRRVLAAAASH
jgi:hypothetical protein